MKTARYDSWVVSIGLLLSLAACTSTPGPAPARLASASPVLVNSPIPAATLTLTPPPTASATITPSPAPTATSTQPPLNLSNPQIAVLAENLPGPDDLLLAPDGSIYLSDVIDGTVKKYTPDGRLEGLVSGLSEPEGIVSLPDGSLVIAEQGKNRLVRYDPASQKLALFLQLENRTGLLGVDGILLDNHDPSAPSILIPDSPNGRLLRASLDGSTVSEISAGFNRPTGVWAEADGSILVVDENASSLTRINTDGTRAVLASLPAPDDVIEDPQGNIFINTLGDGAVHVIPAGTGQDTVLVSGLADPQGVIFDAAGDLVVSDAGHHRLVRILIH